MRSERMIENNNGFSLIELIVIIAIMTVMIGLSSLSISLLVGSEAKQAADKIGAQLNEVKTGAMARYSEDFNIVYVDDPTLFDWADKEGYYAVKQMTTLGATGSGTYMPTDVALGAEHRYLCNSRVNMVLSTDSGATVVNVSTTSGIGFTFDRATGLYSGVKTGCSLTTSGAVACTSSGAGSQPDSLEITSGMRTYTIVFYSETGKHRIEH